MNITAEIKKKLFETMVRIRFFELRAKSLFKQNRIYGALHLYIGQEAIATGVCAALNKDDYVISTHRGHGHSIAKGTEAKYMLAELMGRGNGYSGGHGGSMHIFCKDLGLLGGNGIVGGGLPISVGAGFSAKYRKTKQVAVCFFGDGAANQGTFHESLNMAALWKLPVVYVCENNSYAATTRTQDVTAAENIAQRAESYGIKGFLLDGNDVETIYDTAYRAIEDARNGAGPTLLECKTFRLEDHCMVIHQEKDPDELIHWQRRDPIECYEKILINRGDMAQETLTEVKNRVRSEIDKAELFAEESPFPTPEVPSEFV